MRRSPRVGGPGKVSLPRFLMIQGDDLSADTLEDRIRVVCHIEGMARSLTRSGIAIE
jgi:hypothetical protein